MIKVWYCQMVEIASKSFASFVDPSSKTISQGSPTLRISHLYACVTLIHFPCTWVGTIFQGTLRTDTSDVSCKLWSSVAQLITCKHVSFSNHKSPNFECGQEFGTVGWRVVSVAHDGNYLKEGLGLLHWVLLNLLNGYKFVGQVMTIKPNGK